MKWPEAVTAPDSQRLSGKASPQTSGRRPVQPRRHAHSDVFSEQTSCARCDGIAALKSQARQCPGAEGGHRRGSWIKTTRTKLVLGGQSATVSSVLRRTVTSDPSSARLKSCSLVLPLHTAHLSRLALVASAQTRIPRWSQMARSNVRRDAIRVAKGSMWTYTTTEDLIVTTADETK